MARLGEVCDLFERHHVDKPTTLRTFGKRLQAAELISVGKRGRGSAELTWLDASRYLITVLATDEPERAYDALTWFASFRLGDQMHFRPQIDMHHVAADKLSQAASLDEALAFVLEDIGTDAWADRVRSAGPLPGVAVNATRISIRRAGSALIRTDYGEFRFHSPITHAAIGAPYFDSPEMVAFEGEVQRRRHGKNILAEADPSLVGELARLIARKAKYA